MAKLVAINPNVHKHFRINPAKAEQHGAELNLIPAVVSEFTNLAVQYPVVFTKNGETGEFVCAAMLGFEPHENLFWQNDQWQGVYLPLQIQRQPFFIGDPAEQTSKNSGNSVICIDVDSPTIAKSTEKNLNEHQTLFSDSGEDSQYFQQAKHCLGQLLQGEIDNNILINTLKELNLLQPLGIEITFINDKSTRLNGLYSINQETLAALSNDQIVMLHQKKLLQPIYTMITSLGQIYALIERKNASLTL